MIASFTSVEHSERNLRLKDESFELQRPDAEGVEQRRRLSRPGTMVQLVECDDGAPRHPSHELLDRAFRRLVEIEIEIEQRDDEVRIVLDVTRNGRQRVALDQFDFGNVAERAV